MKATIGRIVHFYDKSLDGLAQAPKDGNTVNLNGMGSGPYAAMVVQTFPSSEYVNLKVMAYGGDWIEGSVSEFTAGSEASRYWCWPPRE